MSRSLGAALPPDLLRHLSQAALADVLGRVLPLVSMDPAGRPHPMLLSYLEVLAVDPGVVRVALGAGSRSAANLAEREAATLLIVEAERTVYIKGSATAPPLHAGGLVRFDLAVADVLEDAAAEWEAGMRITGGATYAPLPDLGSPQARATLALLRAQRPA